MAGKITRLAAGLRSRIGKIYAHIKTDIQRRPFVNFYLALFVFVLIIALSSKLQTPPKEIEAKNPSKQVSLYYIGSAPKLKVSAQIEKTGVVKVVALSGGVVQKINYHEGTEVAKGNTLVSLSTNYQGGNAMSVQRQLANNQYQSAADTFDAQKNIIQGQRDIATKSAENSDKLRDIMNSSRDSTRSLIEINQAFLKSVDDKLSGSLDVSNPAIAPLLSQKAQLLAGLAAAQASLASADYQADTDRPPAQLAQMQKDLALKQLDLQEKMLGVNKEAARLQLQLAQVTEALMYPSAPISGVVQRIFVHEGDVVSPGMQLAVVSQGAGKSSTIAVAYVPEEIARKVSLPEQIIKLLYYLISRIHDRPHLEFALILLYRRVYNLPDIFLRRVNVLTLRLIHIKLHSLNSLNRLFILSEVEGSPARQICLLLIHLRPLDH